MFCSKCGKDCGEFRFCPHCGTQVSQAEEAPASWSVGMACPHCGGVELEGDKCAFCGAVLKEAVLVDADKEWDSYDVTYGDIRVDLIDTITMKRDMLIITRKAFFLKVEKRIPYKQLVEATYTRTESECSMTFCWKEQDGSILKETVKILCMGHCHGYYQMYFVIKMLAPAEVPFYVESPPVDEAMMAQISKTVALRELFLRYIPCREPAAKELAAKCMLPLGEALAFIHNLFDVWQAEVYAQEPRLAARDENRLKRYLAQKD